MTVLLGHLKRMEQVIEEERYQDYADANYDYMKQSGFWLIMKGWKES